MCVTSRVLKRSTLVPYLSNNEKTLIFLKLNIYHWYSSPSIFGRKEELYKKINSSSTANKNVMDKGLSPRTEAIIKVFL
jgi:hypothetical protein